MNRHLHSWQSSKETRRRMNKKTERLQSDEIEWEYQTGIVQLGKLVAGYVCISPNMYTRKSTTRNGTKEHAKKNSNVWDDL